MNETSPWSHPMPWLAPVTPARRVRIDADDAESARVARFLGLEAIRDLRAEITARPWLDGMELSGRVVGILTRLCGVSLEVFDSEIEAPLLVRVVPAGSLNAEGGGPEVVIDLDAEDPPDVVQGASVDLGAYAVEALALALDPFPRKPGVVFEPLAEAGSTSPFAVLRDPPVK